MSRGSRDLKSLISSSRDKHYHHSHSSKLASHTRISPSPNAHIGGSKDNTSNWSITNSVLLYNNAVTNNYPNYSAYSNSSSKASSPTPLQFSQLDEEHPSYANGSKSGSVARLPGIEGINQNKHTTNLKIKTLPRTNTLSVPLNEFHVDSSTIPRETNLKSTTSLSSSTPEDPSILQDGNDLVVVLKCKLEEQKKELEMRYENIASIQRNFENLSQLYQSEISKSMELSSLLEISEKRVNELQVKMNDIELNDNQLQLLRMQYNELLDKKEKTEEVLKIKLTENAKVNQRVIRLNEQNLRLQNQIEELEEQLKRARLDAESKEMLSQDSISSITEIQLALKNEKNASKEKDFEIRRLTSSIKEVRRKLKELEEKSIKEKNNTIELKEKMRELEQEKKQLQDQCQSLKCVTDDREKHIKILEAKIHRKEKDNTDAETRLSQVLSNHVSLKEELSSRDILISSLRSQISQKDFELKNLQQENESRNHTINHLTCSISELQATLITQKQLYAVLESKLREEQQEVKSLQDKIVWHVNNMDSEHGQLEQLEQKYKVEIEKLTSEKETLSRECSTLSELNDRLQYELRELVENDHESKIEELAEQKRTLEKTIDIMNDVVKELKSKNKSFKNQYDIISRDRNSLKVQLNEMERELKKLDEQKLTIEQLRSENVSLKQQLTTESATNENIAEVNRDLANTIERQSEELNRLGELEKKLILLEKREIHLMATIDKLMKTEEATESSLTCMSCMHLMNNPCICVPCGHTYCESCWMEHSRKRDNLAVLECMECEKQVTDVVTHCEVLDQLVQKHKFRRQTLENIAKISREYVSNSMSKLNVDQ